ncbi:damage-inducible protein J [Pseudoalteromonas sp. JBTF-M23]|uniref:Damage-inducible protein J n=1 Tax=Pseudoalteromonas caenipelagi TaxID=2726988 RepID=A0A849V8W4_9GAMM|nr:damage-inducible protein J [Pseudoalteromonas caenipelagi]
MAEQQRKELLHDTCLTKQVNRAFENLDSRKSSFIEHETAKTTMAERKAKIRSKGQRLFYEKKSR